MKWKSNNQNGIESKDMWLVCEYWCALIAFANKNFPTSMFDVFGKPLHLYSMATSVTERLPFHLPQSYSIQSFSFCIDKSMSCTYLFDCCRWFQQWKKFAASDFKPWGILWTGHSSCSTRNWWNCHGIPLPAADRSGWWCSPNTCCEGPCIREIHCSWMCHGSI